MAKSKENEQEFNINVCEIKHKVIEKEIEDIKNHMREKYDEIISMIKELNASNKEEFEKDKNNLKDKIIVTEKSLGDKIDKIADSLKGGENPGVWEVIRSLEKKYRILLIAIGIIGIFIIGGDLKGITFDTIKDLISKIWTIIF